MTEDGLIYNIPYIFKEQFAQNENSCHLLTLLCIANLYALLSFVEHKRKTQGYHMAL